MKKTFAFIAAFGILFLFLIQTTGTLVESIYILDLMHTSLDEKALGVLFFFTPVLLLPLRRKAPDLLVWISLGVLVGSRGVMPYLNTADRMLAAGLGTGCALLLLAVLLSARPKGEVHFPVGWQVSAGLALAVSLSVLLRTWNGSVDLSLTTGGSWIGWSLGVLLAGCLTQVDWRVQSERAPRRRGLAGAVLGIFLVFALVYFAFSAPAVIARWTAGSYPLIVIAVSLLASGWAWMVVRWPGLPHKLSRGGVVIWNLAFTLSLAATLFTQRVSFPQEPGGVVMAAGSANILQSIPLVLMLALFPVLFVDLGLFTHTLQAQSTAPAELVPGFLVGGLVLVLLVFISIFTNVWGYVKPISTPFRNQFWLPFLLSAGGLVLLVGFRKTDRKGASAPPGPFSWGWTALLAVIFLGSAIASLRMAPRPSVAAAPASLVVMTYNIQAGNDSAAEPAFDRQLALIRQVSPDVLALQESDTARIALNNNDYVRYFAERLGYYSYYGPATVTGTFGTAILSKYPLLNTQVIFSYSDSDEIGTTEAQIEVAGRRFTIFDVHPDGSDTAKLAFARVLLAQAEGKPNVIALGDYNARKTDPSYRLIAGTFTNAWTSVYPSEISPDGTDMSGRNRIDHIFIAPGLSARNPRYILPPDSATDHPVHWAEIFWEN